MMVSILLVLHVVYSWAHLSWSITSMYILICSLAQLKNSIWSSWLSDTAGVKCKTDNSLNTFCVLFGKNKVLVGYLVGGSQVERKRREGRGERNTTEQTDKSLTWKYTGDLGKKTFHCSDWDAIFLILHACYYFLHLDNRVTVGEKRGKEGERKHERESVSSFHELSSVSGGCVWTSQREVNRYKQVSVWFSHVFRAQRERKLVTNNQHCQVLPHF